MMNYLGVLRRVRAPRVPAPRGLLVVGLALAIVVAGTAIAQDEIDRAAELLASGDYQGAFDLADAALDKADDPRAHLMLASASIKLGRFAKARTHLEIARELAPDLAELDYQFGMLEEARGDEARAEGKTKRAKKRYLDAVVSFDRELGAAPEHLGALEAKATCLIYAGEDDRAIAALERWIEVDPDSAEARVHLAALEAGAGRSHPPEPPPTAASPAPSVQESPEPPPASPPPTSPGASTPEPAVPSVPANPEPASSETPPPDAGPPPPSATPREEPLPEPSGSTSGIPAYATVRAKYLEGDPEGAHELLERVRAELGDSWRTQGLVALDLLAREQPVEASEALATFLGMDPPDDEVRAIAQAYAELYRDLQVSWAAAGGNEEKLPEVTLRVQVVYPSDAKRLNVSAEVNLLLRVEKDGTVGEILIYAVTISHDPSFHRNDFETATREAVTQWEFRPATREGEPVALVVPVSIDFTPAGERKKRKNRKDKR